MSRTPYPEKILAFRRLPAENRPGIVLHSDQGMDLANARKERVARAPIHHNAIGMLRWRRRWLCRCLLPREICGQQLAAGATPEKAKHAKTTQRQAGRRKGFSHDGSPFDLVQYSANGHIACRILSSAAQMFIPALRQASSNVITICIIRSIRRGGYLRATEQDRKAGDRQNEPCSRRKPLGVVSSRRECPPAEMTPRHGLTPPFAWP